MIMTVQEKIKSHRDVVDYFKEFLFYNKYIEKPKIKHLKSIDLLCEYLKKISIDSIRSK